MAHDARAQEIEASRQGEGIYLLRGAIDPADVLKPRGVKTQGRSLGRTGTQALFTRNRLIVCSDPLIPAYLKWRDSSL